MPYTCKPCIPSSQILTSILHLYSLHPDAVVHLHSLYSFLPNPAIHITLVSLVFLSSRSGHTCLTPLSLVFLHPRTTQACLTLTRIVIPSSRSCHTCLTLVSLVNPLPRSRCSCVTCVCHIHVLLYSEHWIHSFQIQLYI